MSAEPFQIQSLTADEAAAVLGQIKPPPQCTDTDELAGLMGQIRIVDTEGTAPTEEALRVASHGRPMIVPTESGPFKISPEPITEDGWHESLALMFGNTELQMLMQ